MSSMEEDFDDASFVSLWTFTGAIKECIDRNCLQQEDLGKEGGCCSWVHKQIGRFTLSPQIL